MSQVELSTNTKNQSWYFMNFYLWLKTSRTRLFIICSLKIDVHDFWVNLLQKFYHFLDRKHSECREFEEIVPIVFC